MIVYVAFQFNGVRPNSQKADAILAEILESCETMQTAFNAQECWVDDAVSSPKTNRAGTDSRLPC
jgi:hypothetical protein